VRVRVRTEGFFQTLRLWIAGAIIFAAFVALVWALRRSPYIADPYLDNYLQMAGGLLGFTFAANAMVRFKGSHDRLSLILAFGFLLSGLIEAGASVSVYRDIGLSISPLQYVSVAWMSGRTLLAVLLIVALIVERRSDSSRESTREIGIATLIVGAAAYLVSAFYFALPVTLGIYRHAFFPRIWDLLPAMLYLAATIGYQQRLRNTSTSLDKALVFAAGMNVACHLAMSQSERLLDAPFIFAHVLMVSSYAVVLGGTLLDNAKLFDQVSHLAISDPLTGLANHRRLIEVIESELQRSRRTGREFALLLLDLDGLKAINDRYGHLVGSRAIKRLGDVLRSQCRSMDTAARYGGDEFAVLLTEATEDPALRVAARICERLANDGQEPQITVSVGVAVYPRDGETVEKLLGAADRALYAMKRHQTPRFRIENVAACL